MNRLQAVLMVVVYALLGSHANGVANAPQAEHVKQGKSATALVAVSERRFGSAFCISDAGHFITCEHVVRGTTIGDEVTLVLGTGEKEERVVKAKLLRADAELDIALLKIDKDKNLAALTLGDTTTLVETSEVIAFGYPFGTSLSLKGKEYPSVSVNIGRVTALRKIDGKLKTIQTDAVLNPGNSGGPVLDAEGKVIGVVNASARGGVNFFIPSDDVKRFLAAPLVSVNVPRIAFADRHKEIELDIDVHTFGDQTAGFEVEVSIPRNQGANRMIKATHADGHRYVAKLVPLEKPKKAHALLVEIAFESGSIRGLIEDSKVEGAAGGEPLSAIDYLQRESGSWQIVMKDGTQRKGAVNLAKTQVDLGGQKVSVDLAKATKIDILELASDVNEFNALVTLSSEGKSVTTVTARLIIDPPPLPGAEEPGAPFVGRFYVHADDSAVITIRGRSISCGEGESISVPLDVAAGDLVVVELNDVGNLRRLGMTFVSEDRKQVTSFAAEDFRVVAAKKPSDVTAEMVRKSTIKAQKITDEYVESGKGRIPAPDGVKHNSQFLWGNESHCFIATIIRGDMIKKNEPSK